MFGISDDALELESQILPYLQPFAEIDTMEVDKILESAQLSRLNKEFKEEKETCCAEDAGDESDWNLEDSESWCLIKLFQ